MIPDKKQKIKNVVVNKSLIGREERVIGYIFM